MDKTTETLKGVINSNGDAVQVDIQSQTNQLFQYLMVNEQKTDITLTSAIAVDDTVINVSAGHGFTATTGEVVTVRAGDIYFQLKVVSVATNAITVEMPIDNAFEVVGTTVIRGSSAFAVDGSVTPVTYKFQMGDAVTPIDISTVIVTMFSGASVPDDGKFGGITALTNGLYIRKIDGSVLNLGNYMNNQEFKDVGGIVEYSEKAPAGTNGTTITIRFEEIFGQVLRFNPRTGDELIAVVRDDLSALASMTVSLIGSYTSGE